MNFQLIDWFAIVAYLSLLFVVAIRSGKKYKHSEGLTREGAAIDQFLANKSLTFTESLCSIIATEVSALTFLGIPAFAFNNNYSFIQIYLGAIFGRLVIAKVFLPRVYDKGLTVYQVMAKENGLPSGQRTVALFYSISKILSVGVRLFSGSILVSHFLKVNVHLGLALVTFITFAYTLIGGLKAVVRTDILQMFLFILGGLIAHFMIPWTSGESWLELMSLAHANGKTTLIDFSSPLPFIIGVLGGFVFDMSTHGVDQDFAQRLTASSSMKNGQLAIFLSSFISISVGLLFLGVGSLLWSHYQIHPYPTDLTSADHLFAHYIVNYFPAGIRGLMVAGVMAATMSTLDSTINALSATLYNDILVQRKTKNLKIKTYIDTAIISILLFIIAVIASSNDGLLLFGLKIQSWTGGSLLGVFLTKIVFKKFFNYKLNATSVIGAYAFGLSGVYINTQILNWDWNLNVYWGAFSSMLFLKIYSMLVRTIEQEKT